MEFYTGYDRMLKQKRESCPVCHGQGTVHMPGKSEARKFWLQHRSDKWRKAGPVPSVRGRCPSCGKV